MNKKRKPPTALPPTPGMLAQVRDFAASGIVAERCTRMPSPDALAAYHAWAAARGYYRMGRRHFWQAMAACGWPARRIGGRWWLEGFRARRDSDPAGVAEDF